MNVVAPQLDAKLNCGESNGGGGKKNRKLAIIARMSFYPLSSTSFSSQSLIFTLFTSQPTPALTSFLTRVLSSLPSLHGASFYIYTSPELQHVSVGSCSDSISQINDCEEIKRGEKGRKRLCGWRGGLSFLGEISGGNIECVCVGVFVRERECVCIRKKGGRQAERKLPRAPRRVGLSATNTLALTEDHPSLLLLDLR